MSYQTADRRVAAEVRNILDGLKIESFMAHDDINVSYEWQRVILHQLKHFDIFVAILSQSYCTSVYCLQESGIAVTRTPYARIVPLSIDETTSPGFISHIQSKKVVPGNVSKEVVYAGVANFNKDIVIDHLVRLLTGSQSFAAAEEWLSFLVPYFGEASQAQITDVLRGAERNNQIWAAHRNRAILLDLLGRHGRNLPMEVERSLYEKLNG